MHKPKTIEICQLSLVGPIYKPLSRGLGLPPHLKKFEHKMLIFSYPSVLTYVLGAQKSCLIETVLLSTNNICFG